MATVLRERSNSNIVPITSEGILQRSLHAKMSAGCEGSMIEVTWWEKMNEKGQTAVDLRILCVARARFPCVFRFECS